MSITLHVLPLPSAADLTGHSPAILTTEHVLLKFDGLMMFALFPPQALLGNTLHCRCFENPPFRVIVTVPLLVSSWFEHIGHALPALFSKSRVHAMQLPILPHRSPSDSPPCALFATERPSADTEASFEATCPFLSRHVRCFLQWLPLV